MDKLQVTCILTHQCRRAGDVARVVPGADQHWLNLVAGELTGVQVRADHGGNKPLVILELRGDRLLLRPRVGALLHRSQNPSLLALRDPAESHSCNTRILNKVGRFDSFVVWVGRGEKTRKFVF